MSRVERCYNIADLREAGAAQQLHGDHALPAARIRVRGPSCCGRPSRCGEVLLSWMSPRRSRAKRSRGATQTRLDPAGCGRRTRRDRLAGDVENFDAPTHLRFRRARRRVQRLRPKGRAYRAPVRGPCRSPCSSSPRTSCGRDRRATSCRASRRSPKRRPCSEGCRASCARTPTCSSPPPATTPSTSTTAGTRTAASARRA